MATIQTHTTNMKEFNVKYRESQFGRKEVVARVLLNHFSDLFYFKTDLCWKHTIEFKRTEIKYLSMVFVFQSSLDMTSMNFLQIKE